MNLGPVMLDVAGTELNAEDRERLRHPRVGGVILFARNYHSPAQVAALAAEIRALRSPPLLIAVDHEGGRVQRFREGFTALPPMRAFGTVWDRDPGSARALARAAGTVLATELRAVGVDLSFTPVLDLDYGHSQVIGDRAFHRDPRAVSELAQALTRGLAEAGMGGVGKHFPGHGFVAADSHVDVPVDERAFAAIEADDLVPFKALIEAGLAGVMPAHVVYAGVDPDINPGINPGGEVPGPAGFSAFWLQEVLRGRLGFDGVIFSDDLSMAGALVAGDVVARGVAALAAGCDMVLVCNDCRAADALLDGLRAPWPPHSLARLVRLYGRPIPSGASGWRIRGAYPEALARLRAAGF